MLGCNGPRFGIFHAAKISLPLAPKKSWGQVQEVPTIFLLNMWRSTRKKPDAKCQRVIPFLCHVQNRRLHAGSRLWVLGGGVAANRDVVSMRLMRHFWNQTVVMGAQQ